MTAATCTFLIIGEQHDGEYEGWEWPVRAISDEAAASRHAQTLTAEAQALLNQAAQGGSPDLDDTQTVRYGTGFDPSLYSCDQVEFRVVQIPSSLPERVA